MRKIIAFAVCSMLFFGVGAVAQAQTTTPTWPGDVIEDTMWIDHLGFLPGPGVTVDLTSTTATPPSSLLVTGPASGVGFVEKVLEATPGYLVTGVRVCYDAGTGPSVAHLIQNGIPTDLVLAADPDNAGCLEKELPATAVLDPVDGPIHLVIDVNAAETFGLAAVGLDLALDPESAIGVQIAALLELINTHQHVYLTGKGVGHNNTRALTTAPTTDTITDPGTKPGKKPGKKPGVKKNGKNKKPRGFNF